MQIVKQGQSLHTALAGLAIGFSVFSFNHAWSRVFPTLFSSRCMNGAWVTLTLLLGVLLGSLYFSRRLRILHSRIWLFPFMQVGLAVTAVLAWHLLRTMGGLYPGLQNLGLSSHTALIATGGLLSFLVLFVPGFLLSGLLSYGITPPGGRGRIERTGAFAALLFFGFTLAALGHAFALVPPAGVWMGCMVGAVVLAASGLIGLLVFRRMPGAGREGGVSEAGADSDGGGAPEPAVRSTGRALVSRAAYAGYVFCAVVCSIMGTRVLYLAAGDNVYTAALAATVFFAGLGVGSILSIGSRRGRIDGTLWLGAAAGLTGVFWLVAGREGSSLPLAFLASVRGAPLTWAGLLRAYFMMSLTMLFIPGIMLGSTIPIAAAGARLPAGSSGGWHGGESGGSSGGAIAGGITPLALGAFHAYLVFCKLPSEGLSLRTLLILTPWLSIACGWVLLAGSRSSIWRRLLPAASILIAAIVATATAPAWNRANIAAGIHTMPGRFAATENLESVLRMSDVVFYREAGDATVSVERAPDGLVLKAGGAFIAGTGSGSVPERLSLHVPLLLHPEPRRVFVVGLGTGVGLLSAEAYPLEAVECAEALSGVIGAAPVFAPYNLNSTDDRRVNLVPGDPWFRLTLSDQTYDVIYLAPPVPYRLASAELLTAEFFELVRSKLAPGGLTCQSIRTADMSLESLLRVAKAFAAYFPHMSVWWAGADRILIIGSMEPHGFERQAVGERMKQEAVREDLARINLTDPLGVLTCRMMGRENLIELAGYTNPNTMNRNSLAYAWPKWIAEAERTSSLASLEEASTNPVTLLRALGRGSTEYKLMRDQLGRCMRSRRLHTEAMALTAEGRLREALQIMDGSASGCAVNGPLSLRLADQYVLWSRDRAARGRLEEAIESARRAVELNPQSPFTYYNLASLEMNRDVATAAALLVKAIALDPRYVPALLLKAEAELAGGRTEDAAETIGRALSLDPFNLRARYLRGLSLVRREMYEEGRGELAEVLRGEPDNKEALEVVAYSWILEGDLDRAEETYEDILAMDPRDIGALNNYATVLAEKGEYEKAIEFWTQALALSPGNRDIIDNIEEARQKMRR